MAWFFRAHGSPQRRDSDSQRLTRGSSAPRSRTAAASTMDPLRLKSVKERRGAGGPAPQGQNERKSARGNDESIVPVQASSFSLSLSLCLSVRSSPASPSPLLYLYSSSSLLLLLLPGLFYGFNFFLPASLVLYCALSVRRIAPSPRSREAESEAALPHYGSLSEVKMKRGTGAISAG